LIVPVQTSIGRPGWISFDLVEWRTVMLCGVLGESNREVYRRRYRRRLHQRTTRVLAELEELRATYDGWPLALCCFEDLSKPGQWGHRTMLAEWLEHHLGLKIPGLGGR
jgi:hypothetical protein